MNIKRIILPIALLAVISGAFANELSLSNKIKETAISDPARTVYALGVNDGSNAVQILQLKRLESIDKHLLLLNAHVQVQNRLTVMTNKLLERIENVLGRQS